MGYDQQGNCPMLVGGACSIYEDRPLTCRQYDCRIFAATGIEVGGREKVRIQDRVARWMFGYPTSQDRLEHSAVLATVRFLRDNARLFPGGAVPHNPSQLAILAITTYRALLPAAGAAKIEDNADPVEVAARIVLAAKEFDARMEPCRGDS